MYNIIMESLAILIVVMLGVIFLLPWFVFITLKLLTWFKAPKFLVMFILLVSTLEFLGWLAIYINLLINVRIYMDLFLLLALIGVYFSIKEVKSLIKKYL